MEAECAFDWMLEAYFFVKSRYNVGYSTSGKCILHNPFACRRDSDRIPWLARPRPQSIFPKHLYCVHAITPRPLVMTINIGAGDFPYPPRPIFFPNRISPTARRMRRHQGIKLPCQNRSQRTIRLNPHECTDKPRVSNPCSASVRTATLLPSADSK